MATRDPFALVSAYASASVDVTPELVTLVTDEDNILVFTVELYPGLAPDRVVVT